MGDRLLVLGFATGHVTLLVVLGVIGLHVTGALGPFLEPIGTGLGTLLFCVLWIVAIVTHWYGFATVDPWSIGTGRMRVRWLGAGFAWGALTGAGTFWVLAVLGLLAIAVTDPANLRGVFGLPTLFIAMVGTTLGLVIGGAVGIVAATIDAGIVWMVERLGDWS